MFFFLDVKIFITDICYQKKPFLLGAQKGNIIFKTTILQKKIFLHRLQNVIGEFIYISWFFYFLIYLLYQNVQFRVRNVIFDIFFILIVISKEKCPFCQWLFLSPMGFSRPPPWRSFRNWLCPTVTHPTTTRMSCFWPQGSLVKRTLLSRVANISGSLGVRLFCVVDVN